MDRIDFQDAESREAIEMILSAFPKKDYARAEWEKEGYFDPDEVPAMVYFRLIKELISKVDALEIGEGEDN